MKYALPIWILVLVLIN